MGFSRWTIYCTTKVWLSLFVAWPPDVFPFLVCLFSPTFCIEYITREMQFFLQLPEALLLLQTACLLRHDAYDLINDKWYVFSPGAVHSIQELKLTSPLPKGKCEETFGHFLPQTHAYLGDQLLTCIPITVPSTIMWSVTINRWFAKKIINTWIGHI